MLEGEENVWCVNMLKRSFLLLFGMCIVTCFVPAAPPHHAEDEKRPVTVEDSIRMTKLADSYYYYGDLSFFGDGGASARTHVAKFSPDGKRFTICLRKGNIEGNTNEFSLLLYKTDAVFNSPAPEVIVTMSSSSNLNAIESIIWLADNETVAFLGGPGNEVRQVYTYNIPSHKLTKITSSSTNVISFGISSSGERVAFVAEKPAESVWDEQTQRLGVIVSTEYSIFDLIQGHTEQGLASQLFVKSRSSRPMPMGQKMSIWGPPFLSPDGKYIVIANRPTNIPAEWKEYSDPSLRSFAKAKLKPDEPSLFRRYHLIDTDTGESQVLLNSPIGGMRNQEVVWSPDSRAVAISGVYLPLDNTDGIERKTRQESIFSVEVRVPNGEFTKVSQGDSEVKAWNEKTNQLVLVGRNDKPGKTFNFRKRNATWEEATDTIAPGVRPEIVLQEDTNHPPEIYAVDASDDRKALLLDLNPKFKTLRFGIEEVIHWKTSDGHDVQGGLYYPVDYVPGKKYPLVIQTHGFLADKFGIDGAYVAPFAAQPLAANGIMVLQADEDYGTADGTPGEVDREVDRIESAIDYLDRKRFIDSARVGVIGFSRTCLHVTFALTHSKYHFAAACVFRGKAGTIPGSSRSAFRNESGHDSGMNPVTDSDLKPVSFGHLSGP